MGFFIIGNRGGRKYCRVASIIISWFKRGNSKVRTSISSFFCKMHNISIKFTIFAIQFLKLINMALFSERYGYTQPSNVIVRQEITIDIQNAICNCYDQLKERMGGYYLNLQEYIWTNHYNLRKSKFQDNLYFSNFDLFINSFENSDIKWYEKLDLIDKTFAFFEMPICYTSSWVKNMLQKDLNDEFARLNFAYRIIDGYVVEVSSEEEVKAIEDALTTEVESVKHHLSSALEKLSEGDYRNSIKESASAFEAFTRDISGESTYSLKWLNKEGVIIHGMLKDIMDKMYYYTCDKEVGCRHSHMDPNSPYTPTSDEAVFMLVSFSSVINYLTKKRQ